MDLFKKSLLCGCRVTHKIAEVFDDSAKRFLMEP